MFAGWSWTNNQKKTMYSVNSLSISYCSWYIMALFWNKLVTLNYLLQLTLGRFLSACLKTHVCVCDCRSCKLYSRTCGTVPYSTSAVKAYFIIAALPRFRHSHTRTSAPKHWITQLGLETTGLNQVLKNPGQSQVNNGTDDRRTQTEWCLSQMAKSAKKITNLNALFCDTFLQQMPWWVLIPSAGSLAHYSLLK